MEYVSVLQWLLVVVALAALSLPVTARLFEPLPGRGAGFVLPLALVFVTTVVYWVGHLAYGLPAMALGVLSLAAVAAAVGLDRDALRDGRVEPASELRVDRTALAEVGVVFLAGFLFVLAIRAADPAADPIAGEKFLDFGILRSLARADALPPEDMWFAGEPVRYYYGGHLVTSILSRLSGVAPGVAYNLGLATFYGALVAAAYDLAGSIDAVRGGSRRLAGALAAFFVGVAGNLVTGGRLLLVAVASGSTERELARRFAELSPQLTAADVLAGADSFSYWDASRVVPDTINEFPLFGWLNGDLHGHMMGTPFLLLGAAVAFAYYLTPGSDVGRRRTLLLGALPVLGGFQIVADTWSFPSIFGVAWIALFLAPADPLTILPGGLGGRLRRRIGVPDAPSGSNGSDGPSRSNRSSGADGAGGRGAGDARADGTSADTRGAGARSGWLASELVRLVGATAVVGVGAGLAALLGLPFLLGAGASREIALLSAGMRSPLGSLLLVHGAFVVAFGAYLLGGLRTDRPGLVALAVVAFAVIALSQGLAGVAVALPLLAAAWLAHRLSDGVGYEAVLIAAGAGLVLLVEFVYVNEQAGPGRMNTVFKTYMQVWVLWAPAIGVALAKLVRAPPSTPRHRLPPGTRRVAASALVVSLLLLTSAYGALALGQHFRGGVGDTLDATAYAEERHPEEAAAIRWLDARDGQPTILAAPGTSVYPTAASGSYPYPPGMYNWNANPASSLTGLPTVAGWGHEVGYRGPDAYYDRVNAVDRAFTGSTADRVSLLREYDVQYVWVGPAERARYGENVSFASVPGVEARVETETVTVYAVDQAALPGGAASTQSTPAAGAASERAAPSTVAREEVARETSKEESRTGVEWE